MSGGTRRRSGEASRRSSVSESESDDVSLAIDPALDRSGSERLPVDRETSSLSSDGDTHALLRQLGPRVLSMADVSNREEYEVTGDVDSYVVVCTTLEPFRCDTIMKVHTSPVKIGPSQNVKTTKYLSNRLSFGPLSEPMFSCRDEEIDKRATWYETQLGTIDSRAVHVLFQLDRDGPLYADVDREGRLRSAYTSFVQVVVAGAARRLPVDCETARAGIKYLGDNVARTYNIMERDYRMFARFFSERLAEVDLRRECGMRCVRFYMGEHGCRMLKRKADELLRRVLRENHPHVDVVQLHVADVIRCRGDAAVVVKLTGKGRDSLSDVYAGSIKLGPRVGRYRVAFTWDYGYFECHASPPEGGRCVTFMQAYCSAAKMARPADSALSAIYHICRGFRESDEGFVPMISEVMQHLRDMQAYTNEYVVGEHALRIEEVLTLDARRLEMDERMSDVLRARRVFESGVLCTLSRILLERGLVYRLDNWSEHVERSIGADMDWLHDMAYGTYPGYAVDAWVVPAQVRATVRAEFRWSYFVHGLSRVYNFQVTRNLMTGGSEKESVDRGIVVLRPLWDPTDESRYPLFSKEFKLRDVRVVRHIWTVINAVEPAVERQVDEEEASLIVRFLVTLYVSWMYGRYVSSDEADERRTAETALRLFNDHTEALSRDNFAREIMSHPLGKFKNLYVSRVSVTVSEIVGEMLEPTRTFARIARTAVRIGGDRERVARRLTQFFNRHAEVFLLSMVKGKEAYGWSIVRRDGESEADVNERYRRVADTLKTIRRDMRQSRREAAAAEAALAVNRTVDSVRTTRTGRRYGGSLSPPPVSAAAEEEEEEEEAVQEEEAVPSQGSSAHTVRPPPGRRSRRRILDDDDALSDGEDALKRADNNEKRPRPLSSSSSSPSLSSMAAAPVVPSPAAAARENVFAVPVTRVRTSDATTSGIGTSVVTPTSRRRSRSSVPAIGSEAPSVVRRSVGLSSVRSADDDDYEEATTSTSSPSTHKRRKTGPKIKENVRYFNEEQDLLLVQHALETCQVSNLHSWLRLKGTRAEAFASFTPSQMRYRIKQLSAGMYRREFGVLYAEELGMVTKLVRHQKF